MKKLNLWSHLQARQKRKHLNHLLRAEVELRAKVEHDLVVRLKQQEAAASFGEYAVECKNLDDLFHAAVHMVAETLEVELCKVLELLPSGEELLLRAGVGWQDGLVGQGTVGGGIDSQAGYTLLTDEPVIVDDLRTETRFSGPPLLHDHGVISGVSVIIRGQERPWGVFGAHTLRQRQFSQYDAQFLKSIANILASAVERFEAEGQLLRSRDELAVILNGVSEGITAIDRSGTLVYANRAAARIMGFETVEELLATPLRQVMQRFVIYDEQGAPFPADQMPNRLVLQGHPHATARMRFLTVPDGEEHWSIADSAAIAGPDGKTILAVNIFRDITAIMRAEQAQKLLNDASRIFASSLHPQTSLSNLAGLAVAHLADWCTIHLQTEDGQVEEVVVTHKDPVKIALAQEMRQRYPAELNEASALARVLRTGQPEYFPDIPDETLQASARSTEHLEALRALGMKAAMVVPLNARSRTLGAITLIWADSGRSYDVRDVQLAQELANRAAIATENAQLYEQAQALNAELEQRVEKRTQQLAASYQQLMVEVEERRKAEGALRKSEMLFNSLFESAPDATVLVDKTGTIYNVNRQAETVFGYQRDELIGGKMDRLLPNRFRARHTQHRKNYLDQQLTRPMGAGLELYALRKDGSEFPVDIMLSPVRTEEGELIISAIRDITEQKRLQTELAETHRRLFESIEAERRLLSQELHDGPLQELYGVALYLESIRALIHSEDEPMDLTAAKEGVQAVVATLRNICGELRPPALAHFGLEKAIRSHLLKFQQTHPDLVIEPHLMPDGQRLPERTRLALYRVYQNSISNILRHAQATHVVIEFLLEDEQATLRVRDNGRGFQVPDKWIDLARGGHFGLVGMSERVEAVGGHLTVESRIGEGTTIQVDVPLKAGVE